MTSDNQTESQPVQQNDDPKPQRALTENDIEELISFFQLLDEWDREAKALESARKRKTPSAPPERYRAVSLFSNEKCSTQEPKLVVTRNDNQWRRSWQRRQRNWCGCWWRRWRCER